MVRNLLFVLALVQALSSRSQAQAGIQADYIQWRATDLEAFSEMDFGPGWGLALNYWFRLKYNRIEFFPQAAFQTTGPLEYFTSRPGNGLYDYNKRTLHTWLFQVPVRFYIFDFEGDCHCPTFSKDGTFLKKGFFLSIIPGAGFCQKEGGYATSLDKSVPENIKSDVEWDFFYKMGIGAGLDIGLSDMVTLSPVISYHWYSPGEWQFFQCEGCETTAMTFEPWSLTAGLHLAFRFESNR